MSSTPYGTGFGDSTKPSSKVLRPPGGGTSDIFGSEAQAQTPRAVKNHMQSNIFGNNDQRNVKNNGDSVRRSQKNVDSYSRLFGEPERPFTPAKNHMKSNIPIGPTAAAAAAASEAKETNGSSSSSLSSSSTAALAAPPVANNYQNRNRIENGGSDHQNGVSKTVYRKILYGVTDTADSVSSQNSTPRYNKGVINSNFDQNQQNNEKMSTKINNNNISSSSSPSKINNYNDNNYNNTNGNMNMNMNGVSSTKMTNNVNDNNITKDSFIIMNGNNNHHNENESSGNGSNTNSSLISPASTATTNTSSSSASKYGGRYSSKYMTRNPVTGYGIEEPAQRQKRTLRRDGNPVTGEGYKPAGAEINTSVPALNGANQVIIKNRIPPGGYSSGLW